MGGTGSVRSHAQISLAMRKELFILKIGGQVLEDEEALQDVVQQFAARGGHKILVHGGGKRASQVGEALGVPARMYQGRRITDKSTLEVVTMVYAGLYNKKLVAALQANGCNALGMSGADANAIQAHKRLGAEIDFGFAGDIDRVDHTGIDRLLQSGLTPVFCALTHDGQGQLLNTNADTIASSLASAMTAHYQVRLQFCFEKNGVLRDPADDHSVIPLITHADYTRYRKEGIISGGMLPKLDNAFAALKSGVDQVAISSIHHINGLGGTTLTL